MSWDDWATGPQMHRIALLADLAGISHPIEGRKMTRAQARDEIYLLRLKVQRINEAKRIKTVGR